MRHRCRDQGTFENSGFSRKEDALTVLAFDVNLNYLIMYMVLIKSDNFNKAQTGSHFVCDSWGELECNLCCIFGLMFCLSTILNNLCELLCGDTYY